MDPDDLIKKLELQPHPEGGWYRQTWIDDAHEGRATGTCIYLLYYFKIADEPLWSAIYISCLIGLANLFGLLSLLARRSRFAIPKAHADIYPLMSLLPPGDFRTLMKLANRHHIKDRKQVTYEGKPGHTLYFVISGVPEVEKGDAKFTMAPHKFIGEIAFLIDGISSASVWLPEGTEVLEWKFSDLRQYGEKSPRFKLAATLWTGGGRVNSSWNMNASSWASSPRSSRFCVFARSMYSASCGFRSSFCAPFSVPATPVSIPPPGAGAW